MRKVISIILSIILVSLVACSTGTETAKIEILPEGSELSGTLVISTDMPKIDGSGLFALADGFMDLHPNVSIQIDESAGEEYEARMQYNEQLKVEMLAGEAPDLLYQAFDYSSNFAFSGLLLDLNLFMESDPTFIKEDYFVNLLEANELGGGLYRMPTKFADMEFIRLRIDVLEAAGIDPDTIETVDYKLLYEIYDKAVASGDVPELKYIGQYGQGTMYLLLQEATACFDRETMTANFETKEFIEYLEIAKAHSAPSQGMEGILFTDEEDALFKATDFFAATCSVSPVTHYALMHEDENITKAYPVSTSNGKILATNSGVSIPANAKNPALAWEFIKYCIYESEEIQIYTDRGIPSGYWGGDRFSLSTPINANNMSRYYNRFLNGYSDEYKEELISYIHLYTQTPMIGGIPCSELTSTLYIPVYDYFNNLLTAEECAKAMQDRVDIYLAEIS